MDNYRRLLEMILAEPRREDRTGTGTRSMFGPQLGFDLEKGFPAVTAKKLMFDSVVDELLWMISGSTNVNDLECGIWDEWADENGELGPVYGKQWRSWRDTDQLEGVIESLQNNPCSRRHIVSAWNVGDLDEMALPPCHLLFQFYVSGETLDCKVYQRSADAFLGLPFNIASYALLTHMVADVAGYAPGTLLMTLGDAHIYSNHVDQVNEYLSRRSHELPRLDLTSRASIDDFTKSDIELVDYTHEPYIKAPISV